MPYKQRVTGSSPVHSTIFFELKLHNEKLKIAILVDSSGGFNLQEAKQNGLVFLPNTVICPVTNKVYNDYLSDKLFNILYDSNNAKIFFKTAQISQKILTKKWKELLKKYDKVYYFSLTYNLSKQQENAQKLAENKIFKDRIIVVHHNLLSIGLKSFIINEADNIINNKYNDAQLKRVISNYENHFAASVIIDNAEVLSHSGRVSNFGHMALKVFNVKVILTFQKEEPLKKLTITRTTNQSLRVVEKFLKENSAYYNNERWDSDAKFAILHSHKPDNEFLKKVYENVKINYAYNDENKVVIHRLSNTITAHIGIRNVGIAIYK